MSADISIRRGWFWAALVIALFVFLYLIRAILLPFVVGAMAAYFLDPAADALERRRFSRTTATVMITVSFFASVAFAGLALIPVVIEQFTTLMSQLPEYIDSARASLMPYVEQILARLHGDALETAKNGLGSASSGIFSVLKGFVAGIFQSGMAVVNVMTLVFLTPVVTFYLLRDWDVMVAKLDGLLPRQHREIIREQLGRIDATLAGYLRGQVNVCLLLSLYYVVALALVPLKFFILIGLIGGLLSFIPFVGAMTSFVAAMLVVYFQYGDIPHMVAVAAIYGLGQVLEGNILVPNLVGDKIGLHPVWVIFGMLAGAALFGFVGILLAVPVTAVVGVLVRFAAQQYRISSLYLGDRVEPAKKSKNK